MISSVKFALLFVAVCVLTQSALAGVNRIAGGQSTTIAQNPSAVFLEIGGQQVCSGTMIAPLFIVTACHCLDSTTANQITVVGGTERISLGDGVRRGVSKVIKPAAYNNQSRNMDICVLKLRSPMTGPNIAAVTRCTQNGPVGTTLKVTGWGRLAQDGGLAEQLQEVDVTLISKSECLQKYGTRYQVTNTMFCTLTQNKGVCPGDDGAGALLNGQLCGVVAGGNNCGKGDPDVFGSIVVANNFIDKAMKV